MAGRGHAERTGIPLLDKQRNVGRGPCRRLCRRPASCTSPAGTIHGRASDDELSRHLAKAKKSPQRLVIGPWAHGGQSSNVAGEVEFTPDAAIDLLAFRLRWYDRWLRGDEERRR